MLQQWVKMDELIREQVISLRVAQHRALARHAHMWLCFLHSQLLNRLGYLS
jgi:hypothetical protein